MTAQLPPDYPPNGIEMDVSHEAYRAMRADGVRWETALEMPWGRRCHGLVSGPACLYASEVARQKRVQEEIDEAARLEAIDYANEQW